MKGDQTDVSLIMIVRNGERYIDRALSSVFKASMLPSEVLVIDAASTDNTVNIAKSFPGTRVAQQNGSGIGAAYNQGIGQARADLIAFLSHDDEWMPDKLQRQVACFDADPNLMYSITLVEHILESGHTAPPSFRSDLLNRPVTGMLMETLLVRRAAFDIVGPFDESLPFGEDTDWFMRAKDLSLPHNTVHEVLVRKYIHTSNASLAMPSLGNDILLRSLRESIHRKQKTRSVDGSVR